MYVAESGRKYRPIVKMLFELFLTLAVWWRPASSEKNRIVHQFLFFALVFG